MFQLKKYTKAIYAYEIANKIALNLDVFQVNLHHCRSKLKDESDRSSNSSIETIEKGGRKPESYQFCLYSEDELTCKGEEDKLAISYLQGIKLKPESYVSY